MTTRLRIFMQFLFSCIRLKERNVDRELFSLLNSVMVIVTFFTLSAFYGFLRFIFHVAKRIKIRSLAITLASYECNYYCTICTHTHTHTYTYIYVYTFTYQFMHFFYYLLLLPLHVFTFRIFRSVSL